MNIILKNLQVSASVGANNHGLTLFITGEKRRYIYQISRSDSLKIDIQGPVLKYLPSGIGAIANMFLPYQIEPNDISIKKNFEDCSQVNCQFELGKNRLSKETLMKTLDDIIKAGDPYFYIELIYQHQDTYCVFPTKCSLIKNSIQSEGEKDIILNDTHEIPKFTIKPNIYGYCRWLFFAFLYMIVIWTMVTNFDIVDKNIPLQIFSKNRTNSTSFKDFIPPYPKNKTEAYLLGMYNEQYQQMEKIYNQKEMKMILEKAALLTQRKTITGEELKGVEKTIRDLESKKGIVQRILGFFTFINFIWLISIVGISITIGPFLYLLFKPLKKFFKVVLVNLFKKVILPIVEFLHNIGAFELLSYLICLFFVLEGMRVNPEYGFYISFTGICLQIPSFFYSTLIHSNKIRAEKNQEKLWLLIMHWAFICWFPITIHYGSTMLGYLTLLQFYYVVAYSYHCFGLCTLFRLEDDRYLWRETICCFLGLLIFSILKIIQVPDQYLQPYQSPINVFGSFTMFLGLLILSARCFNRYHYRQGQLFLILSILISIFLGFVFDIDGMRNTAIAFFILFVLELYTEVHFENNWNPWFYFFLMSILLWRTALYLHNHPQYIVSLFSMFE